MDKSTFEKIIKSPSSISSEEAKKLESLAKEFPYCQMAHLLLANESYMNKSMHYPKKLRKASTYILDRSILHSLLHTSVKEVEKVAVNKDVKEVASEAPIENKKNSTKSTKPVDGEIKEIEQNLRDLKINKERFIRLANLEYRSNTSIPKPLFRNKRFTRNINIGLGEEINNIESDNLDLLINYLQHIPVKAINIESNIQTEVIDKFIETQPRIKNVSPLQSQEKENQDLSKQSTELKLELVTENFALILTKQNKIDKAIEVYKKLMLKFPDKSAYFAAKLNELASR